MTRTQVEDAQLLHLQLLKTGVENFSNAGWLMAAFVIGRVAFAV